MLGGEEVAVDVVTSASSDVGVDAGLAVLDGVTEAGVEVADVVAEGLVETPVPTGTFWRYTKG